MKLQYNFTLALVASVLIASCASNPNGPKRSSSPIPASIGDTVEMLKREIQYIPVALNIDSNKEKYGFTCGLQVRPDGTIQRIVPNVTFESVITELVVGRTKSGEFGVETVLASGPGFTLDAKKSSSNSKTNTITLTVVPEKQDGTSMPPPIDLIAGGVSRPYTPSANGIAETILGVIEQLANTDQSPPCLRADGEKGSLVVKLNFAIDDTIAGGGGLNFVVVKVGGKKDRKVSYSHTLTATVKLDAAFK